MSFVQIIEFTTSRRDEIDRLMDEWVVETEGRRTPTRSVTGADRDRPGTYVEIVEFGSYEEAMRNSSLPETGNFAEQMTKLCDSGPIFRNLDVVRVDEL